MSDNPEFFRARAQQEQDNADAAVLDNVRERCTRAAKAWGEMADRADRTLAMRLTREAATRASVAERDAFLANAEEAEFATTAAPAAAMG